MRLCVDRTEVCRKPSTATAAVASSISVDIISRVGGDRPRHPSGLVARALHEAPPVTANYLIAQSGAAKLGARPFQDLTGASFEHFVAEGVCSEYGSKFL